jgi:hypothetical protein
MHGGTFVPVCFNSALKLVREHWLEIRALAAVLLSWRELARWDAIEFVKDARRLPSSDQSGKLDSAYPSPFIRRISMSENTKNQPPVEYRGPVADTIITASAALGGLKAGVDLWSAAKGKKEQKKD